MASDADPRRPATLTATMTPVSSPEGSSAKISRRHVGSPKVGIGGSFFPSVALIGREAVVNHFVYSRYIVIQLDKSRRPAVGQLTLSLLQTLPLHWPCQSN